MYGYILIFSTPCLKFLAINLTEPDLNLYDHLASVCKMNSVPK